MAKETRKFAATSNMVRVFIPDSSSTTGAGLTGVLYTSTGLVIDLIADNSNTVYHYQSAATATIQDITTIGTFAAPSANNCRFKAVDGTNLPGLYEIQFLDGVFDDASCKRLIGCVRGVTNMAPTWFEIELVAYDPQDTVRLGLTALPNAAAEAAGGLYTRGTGAGQINQDANGRVDVSLKAILGTTLTETAGQIAAAFKKFFDKASPTGTINSIPDAVAGAAGGLFIAGTNAATTVTTSFTTTFTGNLTGSVASVAAAVLISDGTGPGQLDTLNGKVLIQGTPDNLADLNDPTPAAIATAVWDALTSALTTVGSIGKLLVDRIDAAITSRMATFTLPTNFSALLINASGHVSRVTLVDTLTTYTGNAPQSGDVFALANGANGFVAIKGDTAAILVDTGTTLDGRIPAALTADGNMKSDALRINGNANAAARLALSAAEIRPGTVDATAFTPTTTEFECDDVTEAAPDFWNGAIVLFASGALQGQKTTVSDYSVVAGRGHFTVVAVTSAPADNVTFVLI